MERSVNSDLWKEVRDRDTSLRIKRLNFYTDNILIIGLDEIDIEKRSRLKPDP